MSVAETTIALRCETRDELRKLKRGQEPYDELLSKMAEQYDPEVVE